MRFKDKRVVVTGAGAGIGRAAVEKFAADGATVIAIDRCWETLARFDASAGRIETLQLDVTDSAAIVAHAQREPPIDVLFNCAGIVANGGILETDRAGWDLSFAVNVTGVYEMTKAFLPGMLKTRGGAIVNMASVVSSLKGAPNRFAYGATKAAVIGLTKSIAADFVAKGVRCNAVCPGTVDTPSLRERLTETGDYAKTRAAFIARQPAGRLGTAEEIADLVLYLASDAAGFITGQAIAIDGGWTI